MRFKTGFVLGCAAGAWAASKTAQLRYADRPKPDSPRVVSSRAPSLSADATAERARALGEIARGRFTVFLESPLGGAARARVVEMLTSPAGRGNGERRQSP